MALLGRVVDYCIAKGHPEMYSEFVQQIVECRTDGFMPWTRCLHKNVKHREISLQAVSINGFRVFEEGVPLQSIGDSCSHQSKRPPELRNVDVYGLGDRISVALKGSLLRYVV
ncbi:hypothetical protein U1Q18_050345 [Sarracenia purpurea var. burkii]